MKDYVAAMDILKPHCALLIAYFSYREGKEAFQKSRGLACCCNGDCEIKL